MKEKSIKSNIIWMIAEVFIGISSIVLIGCINNNIWKMILGIVFLVSLVVIMINIARIITKRTFNKTLINLPYGFDYKAELIVYKNIGRDKKEKTVKILKSEFQIPNVYTEWREQLIKRNEKIKDNENFYHFLIKHLRKVKRYNEFMATITVPVEIAVLSVLLTYDDNMIVKILTLLVCTGVLAFRITRDFYKYKHEIEFTEDVIEILCPEFGKNKE